MESDGGFLVVSGLLGSEVVMHVINPFGFCDFPLVSVLLRCCIGLLWWRVGRVVCDCERRGNR